MEPFLDEVDSLLVMTVNPGFGGQSFITETLPKIQQARAWRRRTGLEIPHRRGRRALISRPSPNAPRAGADTFISGTGLFPGPTSRAAVAKWKLPRKLAEAAAPATSLRDGQATANRHEHPIRNRWLAGGDRGGFHRSRTWSASPRRRRIFGTRPIPARKKKIIVGYDRRFLSDQFGRRVAEVLAGNGFEVVLSDCPTPTPAVSFAVKTQKAAGGVMITASHNPPIFNGFKSRRTTAARRSAPLCQAVEKRLDQNPVRATPAAEAIRAGRMRVSDLRPALFRAIKSIVDFKLIARSRLRFAHDALFGVGAGCFDELLRGTTCRVTTLNGRHDPNFGGINPEPVAQNYAASSAWLKKHPHDICLVTDGDADRVGGMDGRGSP